MNEGGGAMSDFALPRAIIAPATGRPNLGQRPHAATYPFIDYSTRGSIDGMIAASEANLGVATENTIIIPGHSKPVSNMAAAWVLTLPAAMLLAGALYVLLRQAL